MNDWDDDIHFIFDMYGMTTFIKPKPQHRVARMVSFPVSGGITSKPVAALTRTRPESNSVPPMLEENMTMSKKSSVSATTSLTYVGLEFKRLVPREFAIVKRGNFPAITLRNGVVEVSY